MKKGIMTVILTVLMIGLMTVPAMADGRLYGSGAATATHLDSDVEFGLETDENALEASLNTDLSGFTMAARIGCGAFAAAHLTHEVEGHLGAGGENWSVGIEFETRVCQTSMAGGYFGPH